MRSCERIESLTGMEELWPRRRRLAGRLAQPRISAARFCFFVFVRQISKATNTSSKLASHVEMIWDTWTPCFCRLDYRKTYTSSPFAHRPLIQSQCAWRYFGCERFWPISLPFHCLVAFSRCAAHSFNFGPKHGSLSCGQVLSSYGCELLNRGTVRPLAVSARGPFQSKYTYFHNSAAKQLDCVPNRDGWSWWLKNDADVVYT